MKACIEQSFLCRTVDKKSDVFPTGPPSMKRIRGSNGIDVTTLEPHAVASRRDLHQIDKCESLKKLPRPAPLQESELGIDVHGSNPK